MFIHPEFDPVALSIGPVQVRWYGIMYLIGFVGGAWLASYRAGRPNSGWRKEEISDLLFYIVIGVIIGGRLGYVLFYKPLYYLENPLEALALWQGGMSFHGGLLGVTVMVWWYARKTSRTFLQVGDFLAPVGALGLGAGRIGNFINQELVGRVTDVSWSVIYPAVDRLPRHPSQLYEAALEGLVLFILVWWYAARPRAAGQVSGVFLVVYAVFRFGAEFFREPDAHLQFLAFGWVTMGQILSVPMFLLGLWLWLRRSSSPTISASGRSNE